MDTVDILHSFTHAARSTLRNAYERDSMTEHLNALAIGVPKITADAIKIGDQYDIILTDVDAITSADPEKYVVLYHWIEETKNFLILLRDVILEETKAYHYLQDKKLKEEDLDQLKATSLKVLMQSLDYVDEVYTLHITQCYDGLNINEKKIKFWFIQINPWPIYKRQLNDIKEQIRSISNLSNQIGRSNTNYKTIKRILANYIDKRKSNMQSISDSAQSALQSVITVNDDSEDDLVNEKIRTIDNIHQSLNQLFVDNHHLEQIEKILEGMKDELEIPVNRENGTLKVKNIKLHKATQQWLENEIYLALYDVEEVEDKLKNSLKMTLVNIKNRLTLILNKAGGDNSALLAQAIEKFKKEYNKASIAHNNLIQKAEERINRDFNISDIFDQNRLFMPMSVQSTLGQIDLGRTKIRHKISDWVKDTFSVYTDFRDKALKEKKLSTSEKLVRYVECRKFSEENSQYINVFMVKGYIGESFVIGRHDELAHFTELYNQWKKSYRGSVLITGQRYSGKSLFVEYANIKVLDGNAILLKPKFDFEINGKPHKAGYDLKETLSLITKHAHNLTPTVIIDDIESWYNKEHSLYSNIRQLAHVIDKYSSKVFFVVTMSNWLKHKMDKLMDISRVFQSDINLDRMSLQEIREVISIRQGATHKTLLNGVEKNITSDEFNKITRQIYRKTHGNVGDSLSAWAASTKYHNATSVKFVEQQFYSIPDITHTDTLLLLETIIMSRKTNEYYLNRIFGEAFKTKYGSLLQRLINTGIIVRNVDNMIQVNPHVVNDVGRLLEKKNYIQFNHGKNV